MRDVDVWTNPYYHPNPLVYKIQYKSFGVFITNIGIEKRLKKNEKALRKYMNKK